MEIGYFYYGKGELFIEDRTYPYSGDDPMFSVIPANIPHNTITVPGRVDHWEFLFIDIDFNILKFNCQAIFVIYPSFF